MADRVKACAACKEIKVISDFEKTTGDGTRRECKACRSKKRKEATSSVQHYPEKVPKPSACSKCGKGPELTEFKWRADVKSGGWRSVCNTCFNAKGYYKAYRERERSKDEDSYLARNAKTHLEWARKNPDKVAVQQAKTASEPERRIKQIRKSAEARGIEFDDESMEVLMGKLSLPCVFCEFVPKAGDVLNGLDRIDPDLGYSDANTAPCCATCNAMKGPFDIDVFIDNVRRIHLIHSTLDSGAAADRERLPAFGGRADLRAAPKKEKRDELTDEHKIEFWSSPCYLCGRAPSFGIDRVDADGDYTIDNAKPCCTDCNYMKKDIGLDDFKRHVGYIFEHTKTWVVRDVSDAPLKACTGARRYPVSPEGHDIIFPSIATAARLTSIKSSTLEDAVRNGIKWHRRAAREYRSQHLMADACAETIAALRAS